MVSCGVADECSEEVNRLCLIAIDSEAEPSHESRPVSVACSHEPRGLGFFAGRVEGWNWDREGMWVDLETWVEAAEFVHEGRWEVVRIVMFLKL